MKSLGIFTAGLVLGGIAIWLLMGRGVATTDTMRLTFAGSQATTLSVYERIYRASDQDVKCLVSRLSDATAAALKETSLDSSSHVTTGIQRLNAGLVENALSDYQQSDISSHARTCQMTRPAPSDSAQG